MLKNKWLLFGVSLVFVSYFIYQVLMIKEEPINNNIPIKTEQEGNNVTCSLDNAC